MKKALISLVFLIVVVAASILLYGNGPWKNDGGQSHAGFVPHKPVMTAAEDCDPAPESAFLEKDGIMYMEGIELTDAPEGYFKDTLFIGDSRVAGLAQYGDIKDAAWYCSTGMSVFNYDNKGIKVEGYGTVKLSALLKKKAFKQIYIGMGVNELGYDLGYVAKHYKEFIEMLRETCPDAKIIIMSNLHVTKSRSDSDKWVNNTRIDELNSGLRAMQDGSNVFYMNINRLFDDETGALSTEYTYDRSHLLGKYYKIWTQFIREHAIVEAQP